MSGNWDKPTMELKDLTREQLIAHCEREASWHRVYGRASDNELKVRITELEREVYQQGYALDKIWHGLSEHGGMDPKTFVTQNPRAVVSAFWSIVGKLKRTQDELAALKSRPTVDEAASLVDQRVQRMRALLEKDLTREAADRALAMLEELREALKAAPVQAAPAQDAQEKTT